MALENAVAKYLDSLSDPYLSEVNFKELGKLLPDASIKEFREAYNQITANDKWLQNNLELFQEALDLLIVSNLNFIMTLTTDDLEPVKVELKLSEDNEFEIDFETESYLSNANYESDPDFLLKFFKYLLEASSRPEAKVELYLGPDREFLNFDHQLSLTSDTEIAEKSKVSVKIELTSEVELYRTLLENLNSTRQNLILTG